MLSTSFAYSHDELRWVIDGPRTLRSGELAVRLFERASTGFREITGRRRWEHQHYSLRSLAESGACEVMVGPSESAGVLVLDDGDPFQLIVEVREATPGESEIDWPPLTARARLQRGSDVLDLEGLFSFRDEDFVLLGTRATRVRRAAPRSLVRLLRQGELVIPEQRTAWFLRQVVALGTPEATELPPLFRIVRDVTPVAHVRVRPAEARRKLLAATLSFDYDGVRASFPLREELLIDPQRPREIIARSADVEQQRRAVLVAAGFREARRGELALAIPSAWLTNAVAALPADSFVVEAHGMRYHAATQKMLSISSGIDWFELDACATFGEVRVELPALLAAAKRDDGLVRLGDGHVGILPAEWLAQLARAWAIAEDTGGATSVLRFKRSQVAVVDSLFSRKDGGASWNGPLAALRDELARGAPGAEIAPTLEGFCGALRDYQRAGVAWLQWLERLGFAGCLADDMGLGKTVQVLALLADRQARLRRRGEQHRPSLVVAPRSVVHNWLDEAARFAPGLRVRELAAAPAPADLLVTTYDMLRRSDARAQSFDYVILDEAHAIKNALSETSKAMCGLTARHRLALTGTPIENHLGELASLFHFLNPGMLGRPLLRRARAGIDIDEGQAAQLGRGLRPFVLRRTKEAVLRDLPELAEQTIACAMDPLQRAHYDRVKRHFQSLLRADKNGDGEFHAFEALLRLRQLACHPALLDPRLRTRSSGKLDVLFDRLAPLVANRTKAIVFSQFTSLLDLVEDRVKERGWGMARLDGQTSDRKTQVTRFQTDPACALFLVSLRAGGTGLNLTAAEYVFLLDPWWNPAVEAQAVARAHRMGQKKSVHAFRLISAGTIEERVDELKARKHRLAAAIFGATEAAPLGSLTKEDLEELLR